VPRHPGRLLFDIHSLSPSYKSACTPSHQTISGRWLFRHPSGACFTIVSQSVCLAFQALDAETWSASSHACSWCLISVCQPVCPALQAPDAETLERFLARVPLVFDVCILSVHGYFGQSNVLGLPGPLPYFQGALGSLSLP
jgi:Sucrose synthase